MSGGKQRLDVLLVERGLVGSRERAKARIMAGQVFVGEQRVDKAGTKVAVDAAITLKGEDHPYVSRGGLKLAGALDAFSLDVAGAVAMDVGASTGGFTDCLLQRGAAKVYAIDVGYGQLAWKLRQDARVINIERTNIRKMAPELVPEPVELVVADCSFISLTKVLPHVWAHLSQGASMVVLVKPQFEAGRERIGKGGVVRDESVRQAIIAEIRQWCETHDMSVLGGVDSDTPGPSGNVEHLLWLRWDGQRVPPTHADNPGGE